MKAECKNGELQMIKLHYEVLIMECPKCRSEYYVGDSECEKCGLIFEKYNQRQTIQSQKLLHQCKACDKEISKNASSCPHCGEPQGLTTNINKSGVMPNGIKGWSWGAFFLNWIWAIGNQTWIGLLALVPFAGFIMAIILGIKGREWAWKNKNWESVEHFNKIQKRWSVVGACLVGGVFIFGILSAIMIPQLQSYNQHKQQVEFNQNPDLVNNMPKASFFLDICYWLFADLND